jgi:hypothetical protein
MKDAGVSEVMRGRPATGSVPETLLPQQFVLGAQRSAAGQPEKLLMFAVLEEAIATFQKYADAPTQTGKRFFREARDWIVSDATDWPFSFLSICHALSLEPAYLRGGLRRWQGRLSEAPENGGARWRCRRMTGTPPRGAELRSCA